MDRESDRVLMDRQAYRDLLDRYWSPLVTYAAGIVDSSDSAQDVVQDVFIRVWRDRYEWTPTGSVNAYLYRITRNLALNARRDQKAELGRRERGGNLFLSARSSASPHDHLTVRVLQEEVESAIAALPERRRETFVLSRFHGLSYQEIAETMGVSTQTVANQMRSALAELRVALAAHLHGEG